LFKLSLKLEEDTSKIKVMGIAEVSEENSYQATLGDEGI
jgi:hypothetical protein